MLNQANILGHVGGVYINDKATKMLVMTNEKFKDAQGELQERSDAHRITVFGKTKEYVDTYLKKGDMVMVTGKLTSSKYTDKNGDEKESYSILGQQVRTVKRKDDGEAGAAPQAKNAPRKPQVSQSAKQAATQMQAPQEDLIEDDLPF